MNKIDLLSRIPKPFQPVSDEDFATILVGVSLAEYFIKDGHTADDLRSAIRTTMHINLEEG
jgi:hypothetical protein